jgi:hypothetical protein
MLDQPYSDPGTDGTTVWVMPAVKVPRECLRILAIDALSELTEDPAAGQRISTWWAIRTACEALDGTADELLPPR